MFMTFVKQSRGWDAGDWENKVEERGRRKEEAVEVEGKGDCKTQTSGKIGLSA